MKKPKKRKTSPFLVTLAATGVLHTGCSGTSGQPTAPGPSPTSTRIEASDQDLAGTIDRIVFQGGQHRSTDGGAPLGSDSVADFLPADEDRGT
ncbi:hypothetical protein [Streptomyces sp. NPDC056061]|uniref:hypothetical protein n=1 Tax=Streptomyces sp. NPDC056061 TaxID=3345700 RepID=UPI0035D89517